MEERITTIVENGPPNHENITASDCKKEKRKQGIILTEAWKICKLLKLVSRGKDILI